MGGLLLYAHLVLNRLIYDELVTNLLGRLILVKFLTATSMNTTSSRLNQEFFLVEIKMIISKQNLTGCTLLVVGLLGFSLSGGSFYLGLYLILRRWMIHMKRKSKVHDLFGFLIGVFLAVSLLGILNFADTLSAWIILPRQSILHLFIITRLFEACNTTFLSMRNILGQLRPIFHKNLHFVLFNEITIILWEARNGALLYNFGRGKSIVERWYRSCSIILNPREFGPIRALSWLVRFMGWAHACCQRGVDDPFSSVESLVPLRLDGITRR